MVAGVVALAERSLLTPLGLRTLAPDDPDYHPQYRGGPVERDGAYHQGTVLALAAGAVRRRLARQPGQHGRGPGGGPLRASCRRCTRIFTPAGLGHVSEVVDGDAPHAPGGCPFQAWSLGELIRIEAMLGARDGA